jgi:nucleotide-binding universal stress UspA family protein
MKIENIVVAIDFSEPSERALEFAVGLAKRVGAKIHLLHSFHVPIPGPTPDTIVFPRDMWTGMRDAASRKLEESLERLGQEGIEAELHLRPGYAVLAITETVEEVGADLVVMGTRGLSGLRHVLLGSIAERTVRSSPCPVITVH